MRFEQWRKPISRDAVVTEIEPAQVVQYRRLGDIGEEARSFVESNLSNRRLFEQQMTMANKVDGLHADIFEQAAREVPFTYPIAQRGNPAALMPIEQFALAGAQLQPPWGILGQSKQLDLHADKLGPRRFAVLFEPVGKNQPGRIIVRLFEDRAQEGDFVGHDIQSRLPLPECECQLDAGVDYK